MLLATRFSSIPARGLRVIRVDKMSVAVDGRFPSRWVAVDQPDELCTVPWLRAQTRPPSWHVGC